MGKLRLRKRAGSFSTDNRHVHANSQPSYWMGMVESGKTVRLGVGFCRGTDCYVYSAWVFQDKG